jgi:NAD(P)H-flavin reductase
MTTESAMLPRTYRVIDKVWQLDDTATLSVVPEEGDLPTFEPAQASMVVAFGVGGAAISISSDADIRTHHDYTIRRAGPISGALVDTPVGGTVIIRGPFGVPWPLAEIGSDAVLLVAGGLGLAPLRAAIERSLRRADPSNTTVLYGTRAPDQIMFGPDLDRWERSGARVAVTVDQSDGSWDGNVGLITDLIGSTTCPDPEHTTAFVCGPDPMMRATTERLVSHGMRPDRIWLSLERNMQCGSGTCGHCQLGPFVVCRDGPVFCAADLSHFHRVPEL